MRYKYFFLLIFHLSHNNLCSHASPRLIQNEETDFTSAELDIIEDLASDNAQKKNYILLGSTSNISCFNFTCEKYSSEDLGVHLFARGERIYYRRYDDDDSYYPQLNSLKIKNAGSSGDDVVVTKFWKFTAEEGKVLNEVRTYNMKCFLVVFVEDEDNFFKLKNHILSTELFNIYVIKKSLNPQVYLSYEVCA